MLIVAIVLVLILLAWYVPVKKVVMVEGVFDCEKTEYNLHSGREDRIWYFKYPCRLCWVQGRTGDDWVFRERCPVVVPRHALDLSSVIPFEGNSIAVVGGANAFGRVVFFRIVPTHYKEEFVRQELIGPGEYFLLREHCTETMKKRYRRFVDTVSGFSGDCPNLAEIVQAEKESFAEKSELFDHLPQFRKVHVENCDWCKKLLLRDEEGLREIERLKQRHLA